MGILRKELETSNGVAPMSSLSVRVKWGQGDLAQLGNFRTFLKKYPEVFQLESNTVHLVNFNPSAAEETAVVDQQEPAADPVAPSAIESTAPALPVAAAALSKGAAALTGATGLSKAVALPSAAPGLAPGLNKAMAAPGLNKAAAVHVAAGLSKAALTSAAAASIVPPKKRALGESPPDGPDAKVPKKAPGLGAASKAKAGNAAVEAVPVTSKTAAKLSKETTYAPKTASYSPKDSTLDETELLLGKGISGKATGKGAEVKSAFAKPSLATAKAPTQCKSGVAVPPKNKPWASATPYTSVSAPSKDAEVNPFVKGAPAAPKAPPVPDLEGNGEVDAETSTREETPDAMGSTSFVPKGGIAKSRIAAPKKAGASLPSPQVPPKQAIGPGRGKAELSKNMNKASPWRAGTAEEADTEPLPLPGKHSLMGKMAPLKSELKPGYDSSHAMQVLSKNAAVKALEPKQPSVPPPHHSLEPKAALTASQAKRPALQVAQPKQFSPYALSGPDGLQQPSQRRRPWEEDALSDEDLTRTISGCKAYGIELELLALAKKISPSEDYRRACQKCLSSLRSAITTQWGSKSGVSPPLVEVCGSLAQGTDLEGSDMDVVLRVAPGLSLEVRDACMKELRGRLQVPPQSASLAVSDAMHLFPHATTWMSVELKGVQPRTIAHLLLAEQPPSSAERPLLVDGVITQLCDTFELSRDLIRIVKLWAANLGLSNQHEGYMNGVAWTFLAIFFLQKEKLVPPYAALAHGTVSPSLAQPQLSALLRGFFEFLAARNGNVQRGLSVTHAEEYRAPSGVLFLEDPAEFHETRQQRNLAETLGETQWTHIIDEARKAAERLTARPQRWFHWAEVFDPRELPPEKIARLQPLAQVLAEGCNQASPEPESKAGGTVPTMSPEVGGTGKGAIAPYVRPAIAAVTRPGGKGLGHTGLHPPGPPSFAGRGKGLGGRGYGRF